VQDGGDPTALMELALSRPRDAAARARLILAARPDPATASIAHQAMAFVQREFGNIDAALAELRTALRLARRAGSAERETEVLATLGVTLVSAGRTASGLHALDSAVAQGDAHRRGRVTFMRGAVLLILGRHEDALRDLNRAVQLLDTPADAVWLARALTERVFARIAVGATERAAADLTRAEQLFAAHGQDLEVADAIVHRGVLSLRIGDLPAALGAFDEAAERFDALGLTDPDLSDHRCAALLAANLPDEALAEATAAVHGLEQRSGKRAKLAELLLTTATCAVAAGRPDIAQERARRAAQTFGRQGRPWWRAHAQLVQLLAAAADGPASPRLLRAIERCAAGLAELRSPEVGAARLLAGRVALALGRTEIAGRHLAAAERGRLRGPALARTVGWVAAALRAQAAGDAPRLRHACRAGLAVLDEHRDTLGSPELHAQATAHGAELTRIGLRQALSTGRPRLLLSWSERSRATTLAVPPVRPPDDVAMQGELLALRETQSRLAAARASGRPTEVLKAEVTRREKAVRARALRTGRTGAAPRVRLDVGALLERVGTDRLVEIVDVDGQLHVLVVGDGRVRRFPAGLTADAAEQVGNARFLLTRLARGMPTTSAERISSMLSGVGRRCVDLLLGAAVTDLGEGSVVIVPPGRLHAVPWSLLPPLRGRTVAVAPSAQLWLRAATAERRTDGEVVLVRGPELAGTEVARLRGLYPEPVVLEGADAGAAQVVDALDGARLAHIAAHGRFRSDSPLFSELRMADGPLTGYDLQQLKEAPAQVVLSCCDSGVVAPAGADELLGLTCSLIPLGTTAITASICPVNDDAAAELMVELHRQLLAGADMATALAVARSQAPPDDLVALATGWSFLALGAG
jgi:tetratricopeptide (TPR) repeat protein